MDNSLKSSFWNNIEKLEYLFSEDRLIYKVLLSIKKDNNREQFDHFIDIIKDDYKLIEKLNKHLKDVKNYTVEELLDILKPFSNKSFKEKINFLNEAKIVLDKEDKYDKESILLLSYIGNIYLLKGNYKKALELVIKSKNLIKKEVVELAQILNILAKIYLEQENYKDALIYAEKSYDILKNLDKNNSFEFAYSIDTLSNIHLVKGNYIKALELSKESYRILQELSENKTLELAQGLYTLANVHLVLGNYMESLEFIEESIEINKSFFNNNDLSIAKNFYLYADVLYRKKEYKKAYEYAKKSLEINKYLLEKENHIEIAKNYKQIANINIYLDDKEDSKKLYRKAIKIVKSIFKSNNNIFYAHLNANLATVYLEEEKYTKAKKMYEESFKIIKSILNEEHPYMANLYCNLAVIEHYQGNYANALSQYENALKFFEKPLRLDHPDLLMIHENANIVSQDMNKLFFTNKNNSNLSLKIKTIKLSNFKQFKDFEIKLSERINIIIGQNASGKTSLLQAITLGILKKDSFDEENDFSKYIAKGHNEAIIEIDNQEYKKVVKVQKNKRDINNNYFIPFILSYGSNFFTKYKLDANEIVEDIIHGVIHKNFADSIFKDYTDVFWNPLGVLRSLHLKNERKLIEIFRKTINDFLENFQLVEKNGEYFFQKDSDDILLDLENLSEGYRNNVLLITDMLVKILGVGWTPDTIEGIIVIDEFDKHLHPRWQSRLVTQLSKTFPKIQFILTTHNPMSILDRDADEITIIEEIDGELKPINKKVGTKKIGISTILIEYFNVDSTVSETMKKKLDHYTVLKLKDELDKNEQDEIEELEKFLDQTVATNFIYNQAYFNFLKFLKENKDIDFHKYESMSDEEMQKLLAEFKEIFDD